MSKQTNEQIRNHYLEIIREALTAAGEEVLQTASGELCVPCVDSAGDDQFCCFVVKVPTGSRDGECYDGYGAAQEYQMKLAERKMKADKKEAERKAREAKEAKRKASADAIKARKNGEG